MGIISLSVWNFVWNFEKQNFKFFNISLVRISLNTDHLVPLQVKCVQLCISSPEQEKEFKKREEMLREEKWYALFNKVLHSIIYIVYIPYAL